MPHAGLEHVKSRIVTAARNAGRDPAHITLITVSKTFDADAIRPVIEAGQTDFGENRVQEAKGKWPQLRSETSPLRLHLIGPLQSNKAAEAVALFDALHTIDRPKIAAAVARELDRQRRVLELFVQVNIGKEPQKAGIDPDEVDSFLAACKSDHGLVISGLMCIPPVEHAPEPYFTELASIAQRNGLPRLSMGMSGDFEAAIRLGATHIRVGSAIFGHRAASVASPAIPPAV
jgi:PLP dependent protein